MAHLAHEFVLAIYPFTAAFPKPETYGLVQQLRRAAVSIPANIAEGFRRRGKPDTTRFMNMAEGSIEECRYYLILAKDLNYGDTSRLNILLQEVSRLLNAYASAILTSGSWLPYPKRDIKGGSPCLVSTTSCVATPVQGVYKPGEKDAPSKHHHDYFRGLDGWQ